MFSNTGACPKIKRFSKKNISRGRKNFFPLDEHFNLVQLKPKTLGHKTEKNFCVHPRKKTKKEFLVLGEEEKSRRKIVWEEG